MAELYAILMDEVEDRSEEEFARLIRDLDVVEEVTYAL